MTANQVPQAQQGEVSEGYLRKIIDDEEHVIQPDWKRHAMARELLRRRSSQAALERVAEAARAVVQSPVYLTTEERGHQINTAGSKLAAALAALPNKTKKIPDWKEISGPVTPESAAKGSCEAFEVGGHAPATPAEAMSPEQRAANEVMNPERDAERDKALASMPGNATSEVYRWRIQQEIRAASTAAAEAARRECAAEWADTNTERVRQATRAMAAESSLAAAKAEVAAQFDELQNRGSILNACGIELDAPRGWRWRELPQMIAALRAHPTPASSDRGGADAADVGEAPTTVTIAPRDALAFALDEWRDAGGSSGEVVDALDAYLAARGGGGAA